MERRTLPGEPSRDVRAEVEAILERLRREDATFGARGRDVQPAAVRSAARPRTAARIGQRRRAPAGAGITRA